MNFRFQIFKRPFMVAVCFFVSISLNAVVSFAVSDSLSLFQGGDNFKVVNKVDKTVKISLEKKGLRPAKLCSDAVFFRRLYIDVIGTLPLQADVQRFLENPRSNKRATQINILLKRAEFADYWSLKWCDLLRVKYVRR